MLQPGPRHRPQVRHVHRPPGRGRGAGVRAGLPAGRDHHRRWSTWTSWRRPRRRALGTRPRARRPVVRRSPCPPPATGPSARCPPTWVAADHVVDPPVATATPPSPSCSSLTQVAVGVTVVAAWLRAQRRATGTEPLAGGRPAHRPASRSARRSCTSAARCSRGEPSSGLRHSWLSREIVAFGAVRRRPAIGAAAAGRLDLPSGHRHAGRHGRRRPRRRRVLDRALRGDRPAVVAVRRSPRPASPAPPSSAVAGRHRVIAGARDAAPARPAAGPHARPGRRRRRAGRPRRAAPAPDGPIGRRPARRPDARPPGELRPTPAPRIGSASARRRPASDGSCSPRAPASVTHRTAGVEPGVVLAVAAVVTVAGEYHERRLFFLASVAPRMPGSPR